MVATSLAHAQSRSPSPRDPLARYRPRTFGKASRWRFVRDRRTLYLGRVEGGPSESQKALIETLIELEWSALKAEAEGGMVAFREGRELRRLYLRALADFERTVKDAAEAAPVDPMQALRDHLARRQGAAA